jgi:PhnB protein
MEKTNKSKSSVRAIPKGFHTVTPYLVADNAIGLIEFLERAFDGKISFKMLDDNNKVVHATVNIGDSIIMISDSMEGHEAQTAMLFIYVENVDDIYKQAVKAKATVVREVKDEFYGDRTGAVKDAWGNIWWIATHVEDVSQEELERRSKEALSEHA